MNVSGDFCGFTTTNKGLPRGFAFRPIRMRHVDLRQPIRASHVDLILDLSGFIGGFKRCDDAQVDTGWGDSLFFFQI